LVQALGFWSSRTEAARVKELGTRKRGLVTDDELRELI